MAWCDHQLCIGDSVLGSPDLEQLDRYHLAHVRNSEPVIGRHCLVCGDHLVIHVGTGALCLGDRPAPSVYRRDDFHGGCELDHRPLLARIFSGQKSRGFRHAIARWAMHLGYRVLNYKLCNYLGQLDRKMRIAKPKAITRVS